MVSIIIVNYNTSDMILECVASIYANVHATDFEILVADNGSTADEIAKLKSQQQFHLVCLGKNIGFGKANNEASRHANGDYLFFLNPDTLLLNDAVSILSHYMEKHPDVGISGGNIFNAERCPSHSHHMLLPSILSEMDFAFFQLYRKLRFGINSQFNHTGKVIDVPMITGADLMISRKAWKETGGFDPSFFMYYEDADLCKNVLDLGYRIVNVPSACIVHYEGKSFVESPDRYRRILDGRFKYFRKHYSSLYNSVADFLNLLTIRTAVIFYTFTSNDVLKNNFKIRFNEYKKNIK